MVNVATIVRSVRYDDAKLSLQGRFLAWLKTISNKIILINVYLCGFIFQLHLASTAEFTS